MRAVERALWYVESHFAGDIGLEEVAASAGLSRFHLTRSFAALTGMTVMAYARGRRLTEAARALAAGEASVAGVAVDAGYGSHEAFTRAFRRQFGVPPAAVRRRGTLAGLALVEATRVGGRGGVELGVPRIVRGGPLGIAGLRQAHPGGNGAGILAQWQRLRPYLAGLPAQTTYGVARRVDDATTDYVCGVRAGAAGDPHPDFEVARLPAQTYAVFRCPDHASAIHRGWAAVRRNWGGLVDCDQRHGPGFERYAAGYDHAAGVGSAELWFPLLPRLKPQTPDRSDRALPDGGGRLEPREESV